MNSDLRKAEVVRLLTAWSNGEILDTPAEIADQVWLLANKSNHPVDDDTHLVRPVLRGDLDFKELAEILEMSIPGVRKKVHLALMRLNPLKYQQGCAYKSVRYRKENTPKLKWLKENAKHFVPDMA